MIEKMLEKFEELRNVDICTGITCAECEKICGKGDCAKNYQFLTISKVKEIVQEVAKEHNNGWIPCDSEKKPKEGRFYNITIFDGEDYRTEPAYYARIGYLGQRNIKAQWWTDCTSNANLIEEDGDVVVAWQPLPAPYQKGE